MSLDNPVALVLVTLLMLLLAVSGLLASLSVIFALIPSAREWAKEQVARLLRRR